MTNKNFVERYLVNLFFIDFSFKMFHQVSSPKTISFIEKLCSIGEEGLFAQLHLSRTQLKLITQLYIYAPKM